MPGGASALELFWTAKAKEDLAYWQRRDKCIAAKIEALVADTLAHPFTGIGKPEPLRYEWRATGPAGSLVSTACSIAWRQACSTLPSAACTTRRINSPRNRTCYLQPLAVAAADHSCTPSAAVRLGGFLCANVMEPKWTRSNS